MTLAEAERELGAPYSNVVSRVAIQHVTKLLEQVEQYATTTSVVLILAEPTRRRSLLELEGLGKEVWEGVDPKRYIEELRREWDTR